MPGPRISYVDPNTVKDPAMIAEFERCAREGTPRPESQAIRAHVPATFWSFANTWRDVFKNGVADHKIKELCRIYVSRSVLCEFCGNQRSIKAAKAGLKEDDYSDLINFESSPNYDARQKLLLEDRSLLTYRGSCYSIFLEVRQLRLPPITRRDVRLVFNLKDIGTLLDFHQSLDKIFGQ